MSMKESLAYPCFLFQTSLLIMVSGETKQVFAISLEKRYRYFRNIYLFLNNNDDRYWDFVRWGMYCKLPKWGGHSIDVVKRRTLPTWFLPDVKYDSYFTQIHRVCSTRYSFHSIRIRSWLKLMFPPYYEWKSEKWKSETW